MRYAEIKMMGKKRREKLKRPGTRYSSVVLLGGQRNSLPFALLLSFLTTRRNVYEETKLMGGKKKKKGKGRSQTKDFSAVVVVVFLCVNLYPLHYYFF